MAYTVPANGTFIEAQAKARNALVSMVAAANPQGAPGGGTAGNWKTRLDTAATAAVAALDALETAANAVVAAPAVILTPAIGYGSMTGAAGVAVAPNP